MNEVLKKIDEIGIIPVVKIDSPEHALTLGKALLKGDLPIAEITFRTDAAQESIRILSEELPELLVGAGTVLNPEQAEQALKAGASFVVSPGFNEPVVDYCLQREATVIPGVSGPTQVEQGLYKGLEVLKFFPAQASGGVSFLKSMSSPYGEVKFIPTGGINIDNMGEYLEMDKVLAVGGSWMVKSELISGDRFDEISRQSRAAVMRMLDLSLAHVGMNTGGVDQARGAAQLFSALFFRPLRETERSIFAGDALELIKGTGRGEHGHIAISSTNIRRAAAYLKRKGFELDEENAIVVQGRLRAVYLRHEIAGFAVHLVDSTVS
ncbi:MAG TPA: bifunctional 4-hydroxy-2-oxoglutarate aldolase/2-dehydro-3-deoxy-phosphogluconate aldolase [Sediminispirochaeta sp.]|nr:bifunctional 4-hydroxy-2-oxoglutarate aldolase/2-dehydro-3-deoxy-phosphogluconate aldolase [Sediminispirochaeta sp.]